MDFQQQCQELFDVYVSFYRAGDAKGCASLFAMDAEMYSPFGPPAIGREAIEATHAEWLTEDADDKEIIVLSAGHDGNLGWCLARFSEGTEGVGFNLSVLAMQPDGRWAITRCSLNEG